MFRSLLLFFFLFTLSLAEVNVAGFESFPLNPDTAHTLIKVTKDAKFILVSKSNPSTGYNWYLSNVEDLKTGNLITPLNLDNFNTGEYEAKSSNYETIGSGGYTFFKFQAINSGTASVTLQYKRPWENKALKEIQVDVQIIVIQ